MFHADCSGNVELAVVLRGRRGAGPIAIDGIAANKQVIAHRQVRLIRHMGADIGMEHRNCNGKPNRIVLHLGDDIHGVVPCSTDGEVPCGFNSALDGDFRRRVGNPDSDSEKRSYRL
ncbi:hypothetical protein DSLASN_18130 [Desulfoluna limicola]|uniref:Uncharacterized protein n=1 Tax=Desulfoluna limicola TaxID=2810562 RepID=A0ABN6F3G7_9BACT|nr:hypothetical protein DSLASN_18130 [Desulfoluna limicola]